MWAIVGIYTGREDNIFWRRVAGRLEAAGAKALGRGDVEPLDRDIIHSVTNPIPRVTAAIHVYGGDFFAADRSEWDPEPLCEQRWDSELGGAQVRGGEPDNVVSLCNPCAFPLSVTRHSIFILAERITWAHFSVSSKINLANSADDSAKQCHRALERAHTPS